ncbi:hypothetical protein SteCoe_3413 [Stentor coeruleus]|uniref:Uncharacterized protein n=1 Tax=Stentor coeruleus TaxID=5963 RepID=A0A1R2CX40_9CILI|nr:hypothetical protein SteCoe_3413 [Stentor coeruleus]
MTEYKCTRESCQSKATLACYCRNQVFLSCANHSHVDMPGHNPIKIYKEVTSGNAIILISLCDKYDELVSKSIERINSALNNIKISIDKNFRKLIDSYTAFREKIQNVRNMTTEGRLVSVLDNASESEKSISKFISNSSGILYGWEKYKLFENEDKAKIALLTYSGERYEESKIISIQRPHTKNLMKIDVINQSSIEVEIPIPENFAYASGWCNINNELLLIHGGATNYNAQQKVFTMSGNTYMINTAINLLVHETNGPKKSDMGNGTLYENKVFFFGGFDESSNMQDSAHKFVLSSKMWESIANLPQKMGYCTSARAGSLIYVTGSPSTEIYQYHPDYDIYVSVIDCLETYKTLFFFNEKIYIIIDGYLRIIDGCNTIMNDEIDAKNMFLLGHATFYENSLYFILGKYNYTSGEFISSKLCKIDGATNRFAIIRSGILAD